MLKIFQDSIGSYEAFRWLESIQLKSISKALAHGFADTVAKEPSGFERDFQNAVKLGGRNALLAAADQVDCLQPLVQGQVAFLKDRPDANRELPMAGNLGALVEAVAFNAFRVLLGWLRANAGQLVVLVHVAAMRANRTLGPQDRLDMLERRGFVVEVGAGQDRHGLNYLRPT